MSSQPSYDRPTGVNPSNGRAVQPFQDRLSQTSTGQSHNNPRHIPFIPPPAYTISSARTSLDGNAPTQTRLPSPPPPPFPRETDPPPPPPVLTRRALTDPESAQRYRSPPASPLPRLHRRSASNVGSPDGSPRPVLRRPLSQISEFSHRSDPSTYRSRSRINSYEDLRSLAERREEPLPPIPPELQNPQPPSEAPVASASSPTLSHASFSSTSSRNVPKWMRPLMPGHSKRVQEEKEHEERRRLEADRRQVEAEARLREEEAKRVEDDRRLVDTRSKARLNVIGIVQSMLFTHHIPDGPSPTEHLARCSHICEEVETSLSDILQTKFVENHTPFFWIVIHFDQWKGRDTPSSTPATANSAEDDAPNEGDSSDTGDDDALVNVEDEPEGDAFRSIQSSYERDTEKASIPPILTTLLSYANPLQESTIADIHDALRTTSNNRLFQRMLTYPGFGETSGEDRLLLSSTIARDDAQVYGGTDSKFYVFVSVPRFHKRMKIAKRLDIPFIAGGRIWVLQLRAGRLESDIWTLSLALLGNSEEATGLHLELYCQSRGSAPRFCLSKDEYDVSRSPSKPQHAFGVKIKAQGEKVPLLSPAPQTILGSFFPSTRRGPANLQDENSPYVKQDDDCTWTPLLVIKIDTVKA